MFMYPCRRSFLKRFIKSRNTHLDILLEYYFWSKKGKLLRHCANGSKGGQLSRSADNPNEVIVVLEWSDLQRARRFANSEDLKKAMQRAGVVVQISKFQ